MCVRVSGVSVAEQVKHVASVRVMASNLRAFGRGGTAACRSAARGGVTLSHEAPTCPRGYMSRQGVLLRFERLKVQLIRHGEEHVSIAKLKPRMCQAREACFSAERQEDLPV